MRINTVKIGGSRVALTGTLVALSACAIAIAGSSAKQKPRAPESFDSQVRADFFSGLRGDKEALDRGMKKCESALAEDPKNAEALVWHGAGLSFEAKDAFMAGDYQEGREIQTRAMQEMNDAVAMQPDNVAVLIPRAAVSLAAAQHVPSPDIAKKDFQAATDDYERILGLQTGYFASLPEHSRGELLGSLAEGWHGLGNTEKSDAYLARIIKEVPGSVYAQHATSLLAAPPKSGALGTTCLSCHIAK